MKTNKRFIGLCLLLSVLFSSSIYPQSSIVEPNANGHEYVDMGLSVLWATFNIGAYTPEGSGDYYAWGETVAKHDFTPKTYKWYKDGLGTLTKYCYDSEYGADGYTDNLIKLEPEDDAAHVQWGGDWRMPSQMEFEELTLNCTVEWTQLNGLNGCRFTSKVKGYEGKSIFLPCPGVTVNGQHMYDDEFGWYWTSDYYDYGVALGFNNLNPQPHSLNAERAGIFRMSKQYRDQGSYIRNAGLLIRPVIKVEGRNIIVPESVVSKTPIRGTTEQSMGGSMRCLVEPRSIGDASRQP